jgi:PEGA domain
MTRGEKRMRGVYVGVLLGLLGLGAHSGQAQTVAESAATTSNSATAAQSPNPPSLKMASPAKESTSPHLTARTGPPRDQLNRKDFEDNAGVGAGKLLLRSVPSGAEIFINDLVVGRTPLLMIIAPGKYSIDMLGPRQESGHSTVGVTAKETQTVVINLNQRYPRSISIR